MSSDENDGKISPHDTAPAGAVCDPVTGVCRMPPRTSKTEGMTPGLVPLPKTLRPLEVMEDEDGNKIDPEVFQGKVSVCAHSICHFFLGAALRADDIYCRCPYILAPFCAEVVRASVPAYLQELKKFCETEIAFDDRLC